MDFFMTHQYLGMRYEVRIRDFQSYPMDHIIYRLDLHCLHTLHKGEILKSPTKSLA